MESVFRFSNEGDEEIVRLSSTGYDLVINWLHVAAHTGGFDWDAIFSDDKSDHAIAERHRLSHYLNEEGLLDAMILDEDHDAESRQLLAAILITVATPGINAVKQEENISYEDLFRTWTA